MRNSIRKIASLCLSVTMLLTVLAMPALIAEAANHVHLYDETTEYSYTYHDNDTHFTLATHTITCNGCGYIQETISESYDAHIASGTGHLDHVMIGPTTVYYYSYTCKACDHSFIREEF